MQKLCFVVLIALTFLLIGCSRSAQDKVEQQPNSNPKVFEDPYKNLFKIDVNVVNDLLMKSKEKDYKTFILQYLDNIDRKEFNNGVLIVHPEKAMPVLALEIETVIADFCRENKIEFEIDGPPSSVEPPSAFQHK